MHSFMMLYINFPPLPSNQKANSVSRISLECFTDAPKAMKWMSYEPRWIQMQYKYQHTSHKYIPALDTHQSRPVLSKQAAVSLIMSRKQTTGLGMQIIDHFNNRLLFYLLNGSTIHCLSSAFIQSN